MHDLCNDVILLIASNLRIPRITCAALSARACAIGLSGPATNADEPASIELAANAAWRCAEAEEGDEGEAAREEEGEMEKDADAEPPRRCDAESGEPSEAP